MKKILLTVATAAIALGTLGAPKADARGFGRGVALGLIGASLVMHAARAERARQERAAVIHARRAAAAARARAVARARAEAKARAVASAKARAAAQAQARLAAQKAEVARIKAENEKLQTASVPVQQPVATPAPVQSVQTQPAAPAPVVKPVEATQVEVKQVITGECKRFIPAAGVTVSSPCS